MADYLKTEALKDIADAFEATTKVLTQHTRRLDLAERNIDDLYDIASRSLKVASKATQKSSGNKRLLIVGIGVGVYVGYKLAQKDQRDRWQKAWREGLKDKQPANAHQKSENGTDAPQS